MTTMESLRYRQTLDHVFKKVSSVSEDMELQAHWARYLCVLVSGYLEVSIRAAYRQYTKKKAAPFVANFVEGCLERFQNPNMTKIVQLTGAFNSEWAERLRSATDGERKDAVDSVVANRHLIAHGKSVGITYSRIKQYYLCVKSVVTLIEDMCGE
jgi:hypothetical protein